MGEGRNRIKSTILMPSELLKPNIIRQSGVGGGSGGVGGGGGGVQLQLQVTVSVAVAVAVIGARFLLL